MHRYTATPRNNKGAHMAEVEWTEIKEPQDIKLVVADMDATLLDAGERSAVPDAAADVLAQCQADVVHRRERQHRLAGR